MEIGRCGLAVVVAALIAVAPLRAQAAPDAESFVVQAEEALGELKYADAADLFERAYRSLSARERTQQLGEQIVISAAEAHEQAWLASDDTSHLQAASSLLRKHIAVAEVRKDPVSKEIKQTQSRIDGLLAKLEQPSETVPEPTPLDPDETEPDQPPDDEPVDSTPTKKRDRKKIDGAAIGLIAGGSIGIVGGAIMLGVGAAIPARAQRLLDDRGGEGEQDAKFLADADQLSLGLMVGGGVLAGVGMAALIWGSVRAVRGPRRSSSAQAGDRGRAHAVRHVSPRSSLQIAPIVGPSGQGLAISGRW